MHPCFEDLRQVAAQLAGLLVLAATGSKDASPHHPMLASAKQTFAHAADGVRRAAALADESTRPHRHHLACASDALAHSLAAADIWPTDVDAVLVPLREAYSHLQHASSALPGFQMVSFEQACCGVRLKPRTQHDDRR
ncbi:MAG TPA: hypothetical protein VLV86_19550 [Vicinamibacterales bacterium]|nr:hypothetical protein [Vicinamibacterales bacterium]